MHAGQGTDDQSERPVGRRRCRLGSLVVQHVQEGVDHLRVVLVRAFARAGHVDGLAVAGLAQPHPKAVLAVRLLEEVSQPGVGIGDREVADLGVRERLRVRVTKCRVGADLACQLGELAVRACGGERRRDAVHPEPAVLADGLERVVVECGSAALDRGGQEVVRPDGQVVRVTGLFGCDCRPHETGGCCHSEAEARHYDEGGRRQHGELPRPEQRHDCGDAEQNECSN